MSIRVNRATGDVVPEPPTSTRSPTAAWREPRGDVVGRRLAVPIKVTEVDLAHPLRRLEFGRSPVQRRPYRAASVLVRYDRVPIGTVEVSAAGSAITADSLAASIWTTLQPAIEARCGALGVAPPKRLTRFGLPMPEASAAAHDHPPVSVIVATRERPEHLHRCLTALSRVAYDDFEVVVVDNAPLSTRTRDVVARVEDHLDVRYVLHRAPGSSRARNAGIAAARHGIVAVTDDDVEVDRWWLKALTEALLDDPACRCVTGLVLPAELETPAQVWFEQFGGFNKGYVPRRFDQTLAHAGGALYPYSPGMFGSGNNAAFHRDTLLALGGFDERLGPGTPACGGEDLDVFLRFAVTGLPIRYEPAAVVRHHHRRTYEELRAQIHDYGVGLGALLTKWMTQDRRQVVEISRRIPAGLRVLLQPDSPKNAKKGEGFPRDLTMQELRGLAMGPLAFARSASRHQRRTGSAPAGVMSEDAPVTA